MKRSLAEYQERARNARNRTNFWLSRAKRKHDKEVLKIAKAARLQHEADEIRMHVERLRKQGIKI
jgi:hypothetical protein